MNLADISSKPKKKPDYSILVVEDKRVWQQIFLDMSRMLACQTQVASSYAQAVKALGETNFSLAVIDIGLDDENRLGRILIQRMNREFPHIPIIVVTGLIDEEQSEFIEIEANPQVVKIFPKQSLQINELVESVEEILLKKGRKKRLLSSSPSNTINNRQTSQQLSDSTTVLLNERRTNSAMLFWGVFLGLIVISTVWTLLTWVMRQSGLTSHFWLIVSSLVSIILIMTFALTVFGLLDKRQLVKIFNKILNQIFVIDWKQVSNSWQSFVRRLGGKVQAGKE